MQYMYTFIFCSHLPSNLEYTKRKNKAITIARVKNDIVKTIRYT